ncbi:MAG: ABC transporter substrate-binding protein [Solobacterium sp.]|nr:ABC transporter substrate-binding protein [Solobacterium sp.]
MKTERILKAAVAAAAAISLAGCGQTSAGGTTEGVDAKEVYGCNVLNIYNWGEYVGEDVISNFEAAYNAKVNYDMFDSNETMYTKLMGGSSYDILVPSDYMIERLIKENMLQPLDKEALTNLGELDPEVVEMQKVYDPELMYSVPYFRGSVGIVYNRKTVDEKELEEKGWDILWDTKYDNKVFMYDSQRDSFMVAFKALGYSMNTENDDEIQAAYEWLKKVHNNVHPAYVTDEVIDAMAYPDANNPKDLAVVYSGDAAYIESINPDMGYFEPKQGTNIWSDGMVIPNNAGCPALANEFINFVLTYDSSYDNSITVGYTSSNLKVKEDIANGDYDGINAYLPRSNYEKDEVFRYNEVLVQKLSDLWNKVKID